MFTFLSTADSWIFELCLSSRMVTQTDLSLYLEITTWAVVVQETKESSLSLS